MKFNQQVLLHNSGSLESNQCSYMMSCSRYKFDFKRILSKSYRFQSVYQTFDSVCRQNSRIRVFHNLCKDNLVERRFITGRKIVRLEQSFDGFRGEAAYSVTDRSRIKRRVETKNSKRSRGLKTN